MKKEYTLTQQFAIVGLDGLSCTHHSAAKNAAVRGIAAAALLEEILSEKEETRAEEFLRKLKTGIASIKRMKRREMDALETDMRKLLSEDGGIEIVPDLLGCDMNYYTTEITMKSYRSDRDIYLSVVESVRGEILEEGPVTLECVCLLWLMRESGCLHDVFSLQEQEQIQGRMVALCAQDSRDAESGGKAEGQDTADADYIKIIWNQEFHKMIEQMTKIFLKLKQKIFRNPYLEGINLQFPFLDRRQAIFVDFVVLGTTVEERRQAVIDFLIKNGHYVEEVKSGAETLLRIDNSYYRIWPKAKRVCKIPVQGAYLQPVYR